MYHLGTTRVLTSPFVGTRPLPGDTIASMTPSKSSPRRIGPSIADVARLAEVSTQTVSRVSTGSSAVREATRDRVLRAMDQLGYAPNRAARALRSGRFGTIGIITQQLERTGETLTTAAVVRSAEEQGYSVTMIQVDTPEGERLTQASHRISHLAIDALIVSQVGLATRETLSLPAGLPVAVTDSKLIGFHPAVVSDQVGGARSAVEHLISLGHRNIHHITGPADSLSAAARTDAWRSCLEMIGAPIPQPWHGDWTARSGYQIGLRIAQDPSVTAVNCSNDEMAFGVIRALHESGLRVPRDVSVTGFDGIELAEFASPPLSTVRQDFSTVGKELVRIVLDEIRTGHIIGPDRTVIPTELLVRASTAPPRTRP